MYNKGLKKYVKCELGNEMIINNFYSNNIFGPLDNEEEVACAKFVIDNISD